MGVELGVRGNKLNPDAARLQGLSNGLQNCAIVVDAARRVRHLAVNAPAGPSHVRAPPRSPKFTAEMSADSAAAMSHALSMSKTRGRTIPQTGGCWATSQPR